jgi:hypothetical protein
MDIYMTESPTLVSRSLTSYDMRSAEEMADILGCDVSTLETLYRDNKVFAIETKRGIRVYPSWQFNGRLMPDFDKVKTNWNGGEWRLLRFLEKSHVELDGKTAYQALHDSQLDMVLSLVEKTTWGTEI